ncbi:GNAT family N-acetyltransferase [Anaeromicropila herbilytica]|uniref:N-acetyltransferase n=1 Tax=Anaeromicropila herbilytica TaxID=2785025 RepID=A0A7R7IDD6_9FIRM|nr:GNAT family N-acetyltransferase [Anaeromicropila herbilytica]BCN30831.1 N-acetyltransferase [Anaeromicropila herbilytica]
MNRTIETERLILRPLRIEDSKDVYEWAGDPIVNKYMPYSLYTNIEQVKDWLTTIKEDDLEFAFCLKNTGKVIGSGGIGFNPERDAYELGYNINRECWGKGYATEASKAMIQWAYANVNARTFCSNHATANEASGNVIKKCGFQFSHDGKYSRFDGSETFEAKFYTMTLN